MDREEEGVKIYDDIQSTKKQVEERESEIYTTNKDIDEVRKDNDQLRREIEFI